MRITKNHLVYSTLLAAATLGTAANAATASLVFGIIPPTSGIINYAGGLNPLVGMNIAVDNLIGLNTPSNTNVLSQCVSCKLNFSSGSFASYDSTNKIWNFTGGGAITVTGGVDLGYNSTLDIPLSTTLLTGVFDSASVDQQTDGKFGIRIAQGSFSDSKDAALLAFYGLPIGIGYDGDLTLAFTATKQGNAFSSTTIFGGTIVNTPVPVPAAVWLMLSALGGLFGFAKRTQQ